MQRQRTTRECLRKSAVSLLTLFTPTLIHVNNYTECDKLGTTLTKPCQQSELSAATVFVFNAIHRPSQCHLLTCPLFSPINVSEAEDAETGAPETSWIPSHAL